MPRLLVGSGCAARAQSVGHRAAVRPGQALALAGRALRVESSQQLPEVRGRVLLFLGHRRRRFLRFDVFFFLVFDGDGRSRQKVRREALGQRYEDVQSVAADDGRRLAVDRYAAAQRSLFLRRAAAAAAARWLLDVEDVGSAAQRRVQADVQPRRHSRWIVLQNTKFDIILVWVSFPILPNTTTKPLISTITTTIKVISTTITTTTAIITIFYY